MRRQRTRAPLCAATCNAAMLTSSCSPSSIDMSHANPAGRHGSGPAVMTCSQRNSWLAVCRVCAPHECQQPGTAHWLKRQMGASRLPVRTSAMCSQPVELHGTGGTSGRRDKSDATLNSAVTASLQASLLVGTSSAAMRTTWSPRRLGSVPPTAPPSSRPVRSTVSFQKPYAARQNFLAGPRCAPTQCSAGWCSRKPGWS
mmetsp:Transcript_34549/g.86501  ORF Transcript_34549/g.86501 Transcript_34549/m.86501 type:complete len:200 (-) Transcript_34549:135-734(-)